MQKIKPYTPQMAALITGAARRIGAAIARTLHADGMNVILHYQHSAEEAKRLCDELNEARAGSALALSFDLCETAKLTQFVNEAAKAFGRLDVLVNNASRFIRTTAGEVTEAAWDELMGSNLKAPFFLAQAAAPYLAEQQGSIVNIADIHGDRPMKDYSAYCISKAGLLMLTKALAKEWGGKIRVNAISPGQMIVPEGENALSDAHQEKIIGRTVMQRIGHPDEIAKAVLFLVKSADYVTGQVLAVDGGRSLTI